MQTTSFLQFLKFEKRYSSHTLSAYQIDLEQFEKFLLLTYELKSAAEAEALHIRSWVVDLIAQKITPRSINRKLSTLKTYYKFLRKRGWIDVNPMVKIISPKTGKSLPVFVNKEQLQKLFENLDFGQDYAGQRDRIVLEIFYTTGMRASELAGLKTSDIDFEKKQIKVWGKGSKERLIPFAQKLENSIKSYLQLRAETFPDISPHIFLLTDKGRPAYYGMIARIVKSNLGRVTTLEKKSPPVLRHSFATHLSDNGADLNAIKALLGHSTLASTQVYTHNSIEKLRKIYRQAHPKAKKDL